jgi:hypothetical protein
LGAVDVCGYACAIAGLGWFNTQIAKADSQEYKDGEAYQYLPLYRYSHLQLAYGLMAHIFCELPTKPYS